MNSGAAAGLGHRAADFHTDISLQSSSFDSVTRILGMLRSRSYEVRRIEAHMESPNEWRIQVALGLDKAGVPLLLARLNRIPSVLAVKVTA